MRYLISAVLLAGLAVSGCKSDDSPTGPTDPSVGLSVPFSATDITVGTGAEATVGRNVTMQYTGWLYHPNAAQNKGTQIDSNVITFVLGTGNVIQGWHQGIPGMRVGGSRRLEIPPALAYGAAGRGPVPGNATLLFEVTLVAVQ
jgi:FKBP-type peptidyl-prolyl cis-trans isomerase FkpA